MPYELADIENVLKEHAAINAHMKTISTLADDAILRKLKNSMNRTHEQTQILSNQWHSFEITFRNLEDGIKIHIDHEDRIFKELIGDQLTKSINLEHGEIFKLMKELNSFITKNSLGDFLANQDYLRKIISQLSDLIMEHEEKENVIINLLKKQFVK
jgi:hypothetical protein